MTILPPNKYTAPSIKTNKPGLCPTIWRCELQNRELLKPLGILGANKEPQNTIQIAMILNRSWRSHLSNECLLKPCPDLPSSSLPTQCTNITAISFRLSFWQHPLIQFLIRWPGSGSYIIWDWWKWNPEPVCPLHANGTAAQILSPANGLTFASLGQMKINLCGSSDMRSFRTNEQFPPKHSLGPFGERRMEPLYDVLCTSQDVIFQAA